MKTWIIAGALASAAAAMPAGAVELVTNGGFETGDFSGWTATGNFKGVVHAAAHTGSYGAEFGALTAANADTLSQNLNTVLGQTYTISFWLKNNGAAPNGFQATFDGQVLNTFLNSGTFQYFQFTFTDNSLTTPSTLAFQFYNNPNYWYLDDVSVMGPAGTGAVPEPASWAMMISGFGLIGGALRSARRTVSFA